MRKYAEPETADVICFNFGYLPGGNHNISTKAETSIQAIEQGVSRVHILDGRIEHCLLLEIFTDKGIGTAILGDKEKRYYHG